MAQQPQQRALFGNGSGGGPTARSVASTHSRRSSSPCALLKRCVRACLFFSLCLAQSDCALLVHCALSAVLGSISLCFALSAVLCARSVLLLSVLLLSVLACRLGFTANGVNTNGQCSAEIT